MEPTGLVLAAGPQLGVGHPIEAQEAEYRPHGGAGWETEARVCELGLYPGSPYGPKAGGAWQCCGGSLGPTVPQCWVWWHWQEVAVSG